MKNIFSVFVLVMFLGSLAATEAEAQRWTKRRRYESVGVSLNAMNYFGDIVPDANITSFRIASTRPSIGVHYTYKMYPRVCFRSNLSWGRITGDDSKSASPNEAENVARFKRNLSFRNDIKEFNTSVIIDLFENRGAYLRRPDFTPYGFAGIAVFHHNPKAYYGGEDMPTGWYALQPLGTEGQNIGTAEYPLKYKKVQIAIPFGIGFKYRIDRRWDLAFEVGWRKTFTDYLDDVSSNYASKAELLQAGGEAAAILSDRSAETTYQTEADPSGTPYRHVQGWGVAGDQRGDITSKDWYIITGFNLTYILPANTRRMPRFR